MYIISAWVMCGISTIIYGKIGFEPNQMINSDLNECVFENMNKNNLIGMCVILPFCILAFMVVIQIFVAIVKSEIMAFIINLCIIVVSTYSMHPYFIGNYLMLKRNSIILTESSIYTLDGIYIGIIGIVVVWILGYFIVKRKDII